MTDYECFCEEKNEEIYRCNKEKAIQTIMQHLMLDRQNAIKLLRDSSIDNPIRLNSCSFWIE